jgi:hypothetical protein
VRPVAGGEGRVDAVRRHGHLRLRDAVQLDDVALRALRHGEHVRRLAHRARDDEPERHAVGEAHHLGVALEVHVVDRHDTRAAQAER